jgi:hypothetical protein
MSFALAHKRRQIFTYTAILNQVTFGGTDDLSNTLDFPTGATHKVYHNDGYVDPNNYLILNNSVIFNTAPNIDNGTHTIKIIVQTLESSMNDYAFKIKTSADDTEAYLVQNDPNYNPTDPNTYYSKIKIEDDYLVAKDYAHQNYAIGAAMDAISDSKSFAQAEVLQEVSRATSAESDLDTRLAILEAAANQGYELNTFTATQGQTTFTMDYDVNMIAVFINGILLDESDYTATTGTEIVLVEACDAGDIVSIPEYSTSGAVQQANQVTTYSGANALPSSNNTVGDFAFTTDTKSLYIWNGSAWDRVYNGPNQTVSWTTQALASYTLATDGSDTTITTLASDPEGFDITYGYVTSPSTQAQATIVNNNDGTFTLTPSTDSADNGTFTFRATATDGVHIISTDSTVELALTGSGSGGGGSWYGDRAVVMGGLTTTAINTIEYFDITTTGNSADFGDLSEAIYITSAMSDSTYGVRTGGFSPADSLRRNTIEYITIATAGNTTDFGDMTVLASQHGSASDGTYGIMAGGINATGVGNSNNDIQRITIATPSNASDFGDLSNQWDELAGVADATYALFGGGQLNSSVVNTIEYVTISSPSNSSDFGDLTTSRRFTNNSASGDTTRALFGGGQITFPNGEVTIDYVTIATPGNATDFGDLTSGARGISSTSNGTYSTFIGGFRPTSTSSNIIDYVTIQTISNASDFGDLTEPKWGTSATSGSPS